MKQTNHFNFFQVVLLPFLMVFALWLVYWIELRFHLNFNEYGLKPRSIHGLWGILFSSFIHSGIEHLYNNSIPLFVLLSALFYFYTKISYQVLAFGLLGVGLLTWFIGRDAYHIGSSGMVYLLTSFLFFKGIWSKNYRLIALSLIVVFLYGSMVWGIFPQEERISWEGHLSGMLVGIALAFILKPETQFKTTPIYEWEKKSYDETKDAFLNQFDEKGNFIPASEMDELEEIEEYKRMDCTEDVDISYKNQSSK